MDNFNNAFRVSDYATVTIAVTIFGVWEIASQYQYYFTENVNHLCSE